MKERNNLILITTILALFLLAACGAVLSTPQATDIPSSPTITLRAASYPTPVQSPTVALPAIPPSPTPLPQPSPTPVIYVVSSGDTLIGIAMRYGVSSDALMLANPGIKPEFLQLGQRLTIPSATEGQSRSVLLPSPTPLPLHIEGLGSFQTPVGGLWILGQVVNPTNTLIENVMVSISLVGTDGVETPPQTSWTVNDRIPPGESAPFGVLFTDPPADVLAPRVEIVAGSPATNQDSQHSSLEIVADQGGAAGSLYRVTATVKNNGTESADHIILHVTLYNQAGQVTGFHLLSLKEPLAAGGQKEIDLRLSPAGADTSSYKISVSGRRQAITG